MVYTFPILESLSTKQWTNIFKTYIQEQSFDDIESWDLLWEYYQYDIDPSYYTLDSAYDPIERPIARMMQDYPEVLNAAKRTGAMDREIRNSLLDPKSVINNDPGFYAWLAGRPDLTRKLPANDREFIRDYGKLYASVNHRHFEKALPVKMLGGRMYVARSALEEYLKK